MLKDSYDTPNKRKLQRKFFANITKKNFVGLCGSSPKGYLEVMNWKRFEKIYLFEKDKATYLLIKDTLSDYPNVQIINSNIRFDIKDAFYDFDFCTSIYNDDVDTIMYKIAKLDECSLTFCVRGKSAIITNLKMRGYFPEYNYISETYRNGGAPMMCYRILNLKNKE